MEDNLIFKKDVHLGYMYCYCPKSPYANSAGKVMEHVYIMEKFLGRKLNKDECVHHIDRDRSNNDIENLQLLTHKEHAELHAREDRGTETLDSVCKVCNTNFKTTKAINKVFCSNDCRAKSTRKFDPSKEELESLVWKMPTTKVAEMFGVSDSAIGKRCKKLGITKPPRGYWNKVNSGSSPGSSA